MVKIMIECCEEMEIDSSELQEGVYKEKGYEFEELNKVDAKKMSTFDNFIGKRQEYKEVVFLYRLEEDIILKYIICPICGDKVWLNEPDNEYKLLEGKWRIAKLGIKKSDWKNYDILNPNTW